MSTKILRGVNGEYIYFPDDPKTKLSIGKFSFVYLGASARSGKKVVIKQLNPKLEENQIAGLRFIIEASVQIDHPGVIKTIDLIIDGNKRYLVQEYVYGRDLKELIRSNTLSNKPSLVSKISISILEALQSIHDHNIVHRDIKPSNIIVAFQDEKEEKINWDKPDIRIIDFGLSKTNDRVPLFIDEKKRHPYSILYSAPEVILNKENLIDHRSDLYSMGLVMMEMFTGQPTFYADNPAKLIGLQLNGKVKQPSGMHNKLFGIIEKASAKKNLPASPKNMQPAQLTEFLAEGIKMRYKSANEMRLAIQEFLSNPGPKPEKGLKAFKKLFTKNMN